LLFKKPQNILQDKTYYHQHPITSPGGLKHPR